MVFKLAISKNGIKIRKNVSKQKEQDQSVGKMTKTVHLCLLSVFLTPLFARTS